MRAIRRVHACDLRAATMLVNEHIVAHLHAYVDLLVIHSVSALCPVHVTGHFYIMCHHKNTYMHSNEAVSSIRPCKRKSPFSRPFRGMLKNLRSLGGVARKRE